DAHVEFVFVRIDAQRVEHDHGRDPKAAADALHAKALAAQVFDRLDAFSDDDFPRHLVITDGETTELQTARGCAERAARRRPDEWRAARGEGRHHDRAAAGLQRV